MGETSLLRRAENAEATARILAKDVRAWSDKCDELREALAAANAELAKYRARPYATLAADLRAAEADLRAARRECERYRKELQLILDLCTMPSRCDLPEHHIARAALAAPADGDPQ